MKSTHKPLDQLLLQVPTLFYLGIAVLIFAASNSITRKVIELGQHHLIQGRNPISLCNVLFVGNICALLLMISIFHKDWHPQKLRQIHRPDWWSLTAIAILSGALVPALIFTALDQTSVTSVVLIGRLEPPLTLVLSVWLLQSRVNAWTVAGSVFAFGGVATITLLGHHEQPVVMMGLGWGELCIAIAAIISSIATVISKLRLQSVPLGIFSIYRNLIGTIFFFGLATALYGLHHFVDAFSPILWKWMLVYAGIIVVLGQLCWLAGLKKATLAETSLASSCTPVLAIAMAYLLLGEVPTTAQYLGGGIILVGILLNLIGSLHQAKVVEQPVRLNMGNTMAIATGFKGV